MKYFTYLAVSIMGIAVIGLFYLKQPNGQTWLSLATVTNESQQLKNTLLNYAHDSYIQIIADTKLVASKVTSAITSSTSLQREIYKWQDENGVWHFSDTPNPKGLSIEMKLDLKDMNVIVVEDTAILSGSAKSSTAQENVNMPAIYYPGSIKKLFEDANKARQELQQRNNELNNVGH